MIHNLIGKRVHINGIVQGVGFRPFVYGLAIKNNLTGWVRNSSSGVDVEINGTPASISSFLHTLKNFSPPLASIDSMEISDCPVNGYQVFEIVNSQAVVGEFIPISPDVAICPDCKRELFNPADRRYRYPFINCTNCGPRFSIITNIPYDRPLTTMAGFEMCPACRAEYENPVDRRFHAQPTACPQCGPQVSLLSSQGTMICSEDNAIRSARQMLKEGKILAIKGLGGYHLACDAFNSTSIAEMRSKKYRSEKPLALMAFDLEKIRQHCLVSDEEAALMESPGCPILILKRQDGCTISDLVSPNQNTIGFMLPYTPLHLLLLEPEAGYPEALVMTSGNLSEEPIAYHDEEAFSKLARIADAFLVHDRPIHMRVDDSVSRIVEKQPYFIRRSRGYAPNPLRLNGELPEILAAGAELKNTFCLSKKNYAFISHHIGDLENYETYCSYSEAINHFETLFRIKPQAIACDMHPDYLATQYARERADLLNLPLVEVQHHHAHLAACLADNLYQGDDPVIGIIFDGSGYGTDHTVWGGEILVGGNLSYERAFHLKHVRMPGAELAVKNPNRMALSHLQAAGVDLNPRFRVLNGLSDEERHIIGVQLENGINSPFTSSMGRLFDAVSAFLGVRSKNNYEGQAAIELEARADPTVLDFYPMKLGHGQIDPGPLWQNLVQDYLDGVPISVISGKFHNSIAHLCLIICQEIKMVSGINIVALSGGVWQNITLLISSIRLLEQNGFKVLIHQNVPANDGGISLGQLMIAASRI